MPAKVQVDASSASDVSSAIAALEKSISKIVLFMGSSTDLVAFVTRTSSSLFELVWIEPGAVVSTHLKLNTTAVYAKVADATPLGLFSVGIMQNQTAAVSFASAVAAMNASAASLGVSDYTAHVHDGLMAWAAAVSSLGSESDGAAVGALMRKIPISSNFIASSIYFNEDTGARVGTADIENLRYSKALSRATWASIGSWRGTTNSSSLSALARNLAGVQFADGTSTVPSAVQRPPIPLGLIYWDVRCSALSWCRTANADSLLPDPSCAVEFPVLGLEERHAVVH